MVEIRPAWPLPTCNAMQRQQRWTAYIFVVNRWGWQCDHQHAKQDEATCCAHEAYGALFGLDAGEAGELARAAAHPRPKLSKRAGTIDFKLPGRPVRITPPALTPSSTGRLGIHEGDPFWVKDLPRKDRRQYLTRYRRAEYGMSHGRYPTAKRGNVGQPAHPRVDDTSTPTLDQGVCAECQQPMGLHPKPDYWPCPIGVIDGMGVSLSR